MNIIGHKKIFLTVSSILVLASVVAIAVFGFRPGIDFAGGTLWQIMRTDADLPRHLAGQAQTDAETISIVLAGAGIENPIIAASDEGFLIRMPEISEEKHQNLLNEMKSKLGKIEELRFETIGAAVGAELKNKAITAFVLVLVGISLYIAFAFRKVSRPVSSWKYGIITLITLFHDALIPAGLFAFLGYLSGVEVDTNFIVAILVVMGFSVHDTIVVFDRIRENLKVVGLSKKTFEELVNDSVNQTIARSINTSLTLVLVLIAMFFLGAPTLKYFVLVILVGTIAGTYSSIFVASPLLTIWKKRV